MNKRRLILGARRRNIVIVTGLHSASPNGCRPDRLRRRPGHHSRILRKAHFSEKHAYSPASKRLPANSRTTNEGPFGEVIRSTGPMAKANQFRFSTKYQDDESDLLYYGYRYYSASTGRWNSRDPMEEEASRSLYVFVANNPANRIDLFGLYENCCCDSSTIDKNKAALIDRYNDATGYLNPSRPWPMPETGSWSCLNVARNVGNFMKPIPPCWSCYIEERWADHPVLTLVMTPYPHLERITHDLNVVVCESHPKTGSPQKIVFDYWHNAPAAEDYSAYTGKYPKPGTVDPNLSEFDCSQPTKPWNPDNRYLDLISGGPPPPPPTPPQYPILP